MPADASIYGTLNTPGKGTGLATLGELQALKLIKEQREAETARAQAEAETEQRKARQMALVQDVFTRHAGPNGLNKKAALNELYAVDKDAATAFEKELNASIASADAHEKAQREQDLADMTFDFNLLKGATPQTLPFIRSRMRDQEFAAQIPDDPTQLTPMLEQMNNALLSASDYNKKIADIDAKHDKAEDRVLGHLSAAMDADQWADGWAEARYKGVYDELIGMGLSEQFTPDMPARLSEMLLTPEQRAQRTSREADDKRQAEAAAEAARHNRVMEGRPTGATAPVAVIGPDGKTVYVTPQQALGMRPASGREQGRPVTSGDAGRISDLDTSLNDLVTLRATVAPRDPKTGQLTEPGATGFGAQVGASLPKAVTSLTGWGVTAKQKQATIDRVKQVIGKALEGGVLRKEDEVKYEKILPTVADPVEIVETKLNGLESAIRQRRSTQLDALEDAGYDVSRFVSRGPAGAGQKIQKEIPGFPGAVAESTDGGKTWRRVK